MKIISALLALCLTLNVFAASGTIAEFERSLDEYQYTMTVEWDQKDQAVYEKETAAFMEKMNHLISTQGLSQAEVMGVLEKRVQDKKTLEAIKLKLSLMGKVDSQEELMKLLKENTDSMYSKGASWNGDVLLYGGIALVVLGIGFAIWYYSTHECGSYNTRYTCGYPSDYAGYQCWYEEYCEFWQKKE